MENQCLTIAAAMGTAIVAMAVYIRQLHASRVDDLRVRIDAEHQSVQHAEHARVDAVAQMDALIARLGEQGKCSDGSTEK